MNYVMEDYLKTIYELQQEQDIPVSTSEIADRLDRTNPSVTSMLENLDEKGLIVYQKYKGVELTQEGKTVALEVIRHHRLLEAFLAEKLDFSWTDVHEEAETLEHHISEELEDRMSEALDNPSSDPHGDPIPNKDLVAPEDNTNPLDVFEIGDVVEVSRVNDRKKEELEYLSDAGIKPGTELEIVDVAPFGMITVNIIDKGKEQSLPEDIASSIRVKEKTGKKKIDNLNG